MSPTLFLACIKSRVTLCVVLALCIVRAFELQSLYRITQDGLSIFQSYDFYNNIVFASFILVPLFGVLLIRPMRFDPDDKRTYRKYSLGMKQRIAIAQAIMEQPELLILDEPTNALDEDGKKLVHDIIIEERQRGATILIASHDHEELASLCDRQYKLYEGRLGEG